MTATRVHSISLRGQAWLISLALLVLTGMLGAKAYSVARTHFQEMSQLVKYDVATQPLRHEGGLNGSLEVFREEKLNQAHETALGLLRLIGAALLLSAAITGWLFYLFFHALIRPLAAMKNATYRIGSGELSCRIPARSGLQELRDLSTAFNGMAERLQKLDQAKTEFLAMISHEIKNPLAALKEGLSFLSRNDALSPEARTKGFSACLIASKRLESMINNLLQHSKMEAGFFRTDMKLKDLHWALQIAMDEVRPLAEKRQICFEFTPEVETLMATFSSDGMIQVFENLFLNAIKYGAENSLIEIRSFRLSGPPARVGVEITNSGTTIGEAERKKIFDRFYRGSHPAVLGMGLGLHVVKTIVEAHQGEVSVASEKNRTCFRIELPFSEAIA